jgi:hypothetical protein
MRHARAYVLTFSGVMLAISFIGCGSEIGMTEAQRFRKNIVGTWRGWSEDSPANVTITFKDNGDFDFYGGSSNPLVNTLLKVGMLSGEGKWSIDQNSVLTLEPTGFTNPVMNSIAGGVIYYYKITKLDNENLISSNMVPKGTTGMGFMNKNLQKIH